MAAGFWTVPLGIAIQILPKILSFGSLIWKYPNRHSQQTLGGLLSLYAHPKGAGM